MMALVVEGQDKVAAAVVLGCEPDLGLMVKQKMLGSCSA